jgi:hypothetical protein
VPGEDGGGLNDDETGAPPRPQARQLDAEDPVPASEPGSGYGSLQNDQLVAQCQVLEGARRRLEGTRRGGRSRDPSKIMEALRHHAFPLKRRLSRDSAESAVEVAREVQAGPARRRSCPGEDDSGRDGRHRYDASGRQRQRGRSRRRPSRQWGLVVSESSSHAQAGRWACQNSPPNH